MFSSELLSLAQACRIFLMAICSMRFFYRNEWLIVIGITTHDGKLLAELVGTLLWAVCLGSVDF